MRLKSMIRQKEFFSSLRPELITVGGIFTKANVSLVIKSPQACCRVGRESGRSLPYLHEGENLLQVFFIKGNLFGEKQLSFLHSFILQLKKSFQIGIRYFDFRCSQLCLFSFFFNEKVDFQGEERVLPSSFVYIDSVPFVLRELTTLSEMPSVLFILNCLNTLIGHSKNAIGINFEFMFTAQQLSLQQSMNKDLEKCL